MVKPHLKKKKNCCSALAGTPNRISFPKYSAWILARLISLLPPMALRSRALGQLGIRLNLYVEGSDSAEPGPQGLSLLAGQGVGGHSGRETG